MRQNRLLVLLFTLFSFSHTYSQNIAPDWTATDIDGVDHHFQDYIDAGKHVIIDFSATWCSPCWTYHQSGTLETMWDLYGPNGTDEIMIFYLESDFDTNENCLYGSSGCNDSSMGDWVTGTHYPIINLTSTNGGNVWSQYGVTGFPTVSVISANNQNYFNLVGAFSAGQSTLESYLFDSFEMAITGSTQAEECGDDGQVNIEVSEGFGQLSYSWSGGGDTPTLNNVSAGTYTVTVTDGNDYQLTETFIVEGNGIPQMEFVNQSIQGVSCYGDENGMISIDVNGGSGNLDYSWDNGLTGSEITGLSAGIYNLIITDQQGCELSETFEVLGPPELVVESYITQELCGQQNGSITVNTNGGVSPYTMTINGEENSSGFYTDLSAGLYDISVIDDNGCSHQEQIEITNSPSPIAVASNDNPVDCINNVVVVSGWGSTEGNVSYEWTTLDGEIIGQNDIIEIEVSLPGTYVLNIIDNISGCDAVAEVVVGGNVESATLNIEQPQNIDCDVTVITLSALSSINTSSMVYQWTTIDGNIVSGGTSLNPVVDASGTYNLLATNNSNGCTSTESIVVEQDDNIPTVSTTSETLTCALTTTDLCAEISVDGSTAVWSYNGTSTEGLCISAVTPGVYTVMVTAPNGCTTMAEHTVEENTNVPQIMIDQPAPLTCSVASVTMSGQVIGDASDYTFVWTDAAGVVVGTELMTPVSSGGVYQLIVTNIMTGCNSTAMTTVDESDDLPQVSIPVPAELTCLVTTVTIRAEVIGDPVNYNFTWADDEEVMIGMMESVMVTGPGEYTVTVEEKSTGCTSIRTALVSEVRNDPVSDYQVENENGTLNLGSTSMGNPTSMIWTADGLEIMDATNLTFDENGVYEICLTVTNDCGSDTKCSDYNYAVALATTDQSSDITCNAELDGYINLSPTGGEGNYSVVWTGPNGFMSTDLSISDLAAGVYTMTLSDTYGYEISESYTIIEPSSINQGSTIFENETEEGASDGSISFSAYGGTGTLSYLWSNGSTSSSISGLSAGDYSVDVTDENGCVKSFGPFAIQLTTGVADISFASALNLFPNPATDRLFVEVRFVKSVSVIVNITDAYGKLIETSTIIGNGTMHLGIDVSRYDSGIYFFEVTDGIESTTEKFMVVN